jgi:hypothetical protein
VLLCGLLWLGGRALHKPRDPLPTQASTLSNEPLYQSNAPLNQELEAILANLAVKHNTAETLQLVKNETFRISCRDTLDWIFAKRDCDVLVFSAQSPDAPKLSFLVFRDQDRVVSTAFAAGPLKRAADEPDGIFLELPENYSGKHGELVEALRAAATRIAGALRPRDWKEYSFNQKSVYVPFVSDLEYQKKVAALRQSNSVVKHLLMLTSSTNADLSLGSRLFMVGAPDRSGQYSPYFKAIHRPMFASPSDRDITKTLAHELTHAVLDGMRANRRLLLETALPQLIETHPQMIAYTLPLIYQEELDEPGREEDILPKAEEMLAFFAGSLASEQPVVRFQVRLRPIVTDITDIQILNEPLLSSDAELLASLNLIPAWMSPKALGYTEEKINERYYQRVKQHAIRQPVSQ